MLVEKNTGRKLLLYARSISFPIRLKTSILHQKQHYYGTPALVTTSQGYFSSSTQMAMKSNYVNTRQNERKDVFKIYVSTMRYVLELRAFADCPVC